MSSRTALVALPILIQVDSREYVEAASIGIYFGLVF